MTNNLEVRLLLAALVEHQFKTFFQPAELDFLFGRKVYLSEIKSGFTDRVVGDPVWSEICGDKPVAVSCRRNISFYSGTEILFIRCRIPCRFIL